jgi:hypothetical protein
MVYTKFMCSSLDSVPSTPKLTYKLLDSWFPLVLLDSWFSLMSTKIVCH